jgi:hypothetical protein
LEVGGKGCAVKGTRLEAIRAEVRSQEEARKLKGWKARKGKEDRKEDPG